jgi:hypothetical protein
MKKADTFNPGKWLVENKITTQSRLNENEEFDNDFPSLDYNTIRNFIKSKGYKITSGYYDGGFDVNNGEYFVGVFDDHIAVTGDDGQVKDIPFTQSRLNKITTQSRLNENKFKMIGSDADELLDAISILNRDMMNSKRSSKDKLKPLNTTGHEISDGKFSIEVEKIGDTEDNEYLRLANDYLEERGYKSKLYKNT